MKILFSVICLLLLTSCGPSQEEKQKIAAVTCSIMGETKNMDGAVRVREINEAREKIGAEPFLGGDYVIKEAFEWDLCQELVLNENYDERLQPLKDAKRERERIVAEKRAEERRIAAEEMEEKRRIAAEKQRIADSKPSVIEEFYANGKLKTRTNYQPKNVGGKRHGLWRKWHDNGQLLWETTYENGMVHGFSRGWHENGQLSHEHHMVYGVQHGLDRNWHENGQLKNESTWKNGKDNGIYRSWYANGELRVEYCRLDGYIVDMSKCRK